MFTVRHGRTLRWIALTCAVLPESLLCLALRGDMAGKRGGALPAPVWVRFWQKVEKSDGCWRWTGALNSSGYGAIWDGYRLAYAHRLSWELHGGTIPEGMTLDHLCRNRACVNPAHLDPVTVRANIHRGFRARLGETWQPPSERESAA